MPTTTLRGLFVLATLLAPVAATRAAEFKFAFGPGEAPAGHTPVPAQAAYDAKRGFGFLVVLAAGKPGIFAVAVDEGNYAVTVRFGDPAAATSTTVKAESRRLMVERVDTAPGVFETRTFIVNVRNPAIGNGVRSRFDDLEIFGVHVEFRGGSKHQEERC